MLNAFLFNTNNIMEDLNMSLRDIEVYSYWGF